VAGVHAGDTRAGTTGAAERDGVEPGGGDRVSRPSRLSVWCPVRGWLARHRAPQWGLPVVSARRAYAAVVALYLVGLGSGLGSSLDGVCWQFGWISGSWFDRIGTWGLYATTWLTIAGWAVALALAYKAAADDPHGRVSWWTLHTLGERRRIVHGLTVLSVPGMAWMGWRAEQIAAGDLSWRLPQTAAVLALVALVAYLQGLGPEQLGLRRTVDRVQAAAVRDSYFNAFLAFASTGALANALMKLLAHLDPSEQLWQRITQSWSYPAPPLTVGGQVHLLASMVSNAVVEEMIVTVAVVLALRAARRPLAEILAVACVLRVGYHLYDNVHAFGAVIFTVVFVLIYERTGRILPLIIAHALWDTAATVAFYAPHPENVQIGPVDLGFDWMLLVFLIVALFVHWIYSLLRYPRPAPDASTIAQTAGRRRPAESMADERAG
jgi:membrane protease YdiL (CAAX protease family)